MVKLRGREQRALDRIEKPLVASDPRLESMFAIFANMVQCEPMPVTERATTGPRRRLRTASSAIVKAFLFTPWFQAGYGPYGSLADRTQYGRGERERR
jgi:hypothetical protein